MKSITRKTAIFSRRTTEVPQLKVWVRINVALLTLRPQITQGEVSPSGRLLTTLRRCVTGELECYCSHSCHRNTCFLQLTAPRCHPHRNSSDQKKKKKWVSLTFQRCVDWLLMTLSSVHDKRQLVACGTTANAHRGTLLQPGNSFLTAVHTHGTAEAAPAVPSVNPSWENPNYLCTIYINLLLFGNATIVFIVKYAHRNNTQWLSLNEAGT